MEENEREIIRTRLTKLTEHTRCTPEFLIFFFERKILTFDEIQEIAGIKIDSEKALQFYMLIQTRTSGYAVLKEGLLKYKLSGALNVLEGSEDLVSGPTLEEVHSRIASLSFQPTTASSKKTNISFDIYPPVLSFTGRTSELEQLHQMVLRSQGAARIAVVSQVTSVSGLGGIGKTQLAREYVRVNGKEFDGNVLWMNAESEQSLYNSFKRCAEKKLRLPTKNETGKEISVEDLVEAVYNYFEGWKALFVLDNAEKGDWFREFMPKSSPTAKLFILITSRDREWDRGMEVLQLDGLTVDEAVKLIQQGLEIDSNDAVLMEDARKLAQTLQCFPLALQQAIAYIYEQQIKSNYTIKNYVDEFEGKQQQLLNYIEKDRVCDPIFTTTTATTWSITFDKIKDDENSGWLSSLILNVVAYFGADNIKREIFYMIPSVHKDKQFASVDAEQVNDAVRLLVKYSILNGKESQNILSVHRLIQSVTRNQLAQDGMDDYFLEIAIQLLQGSDEYDFPPENIGHALIVWKHAFKSNPVIQGYAKQVFQILETMQEVGRHDEGIRFGNQALEMFKPVLGDDHQDVLLIQISIGIIVMEQGYVNEGVEILEINHSKVNSLFGENSELSLVTKRNLGNALIMSDNYKEAQEVLSEVLALEIQKKVYEKLSPVWIENVGVFYRICCDSSHSLIQNKKIEEAIKFLEGKIEKIKKHVGSKNKIILGIQQEIGRAYRNLENYSRALEIHQSVHQDFISLSGEDSFKTLKASKDVAITLSYLGQHAEALSKFQEIISKMKTILGKESWDLLIAKWEYADAIERSDENFLMALDLLLHVKTSMTSFGGQKLTPGEEASLTKTFIRVLNKIGGLENAMSILQDILPKTRLLLGEECEFYLETKEELGNTLVKDEKFKEAEQILEEVLAKKRRYLVKITCPP